MTFVRAVIEKLDGVFPLIIKESFSLKTSKNLAKFICDEWIVDCEVLFGKPFDCEQSCTVVITVRWQNIQTEFDVCLSKTYC